MTELAPNAVELIGSFLTGSALADHLGDIRDAEEDLYAALGIDRNQYQELRSDAYRVSDDSGPLRILQLAHTRYGIPVPDYVMKETFDE